MPRTSYGISGKDIKLISDNNCIFKILSNSDIYKYLESNVFCIPDIQRSIEYNKVDEIERLFKLNFKLNNNYLNQHGYALSLCTIDNNFKKFWVIDGQHRLEAIKRLHEYKFNVLIRIKLCNSLSDMKDDFRLLNINSKMPIQYTYFENKFLQNSIKKAATKIKNNYNNSFNRNNLSKSEIIHHNKFVELLDIDKIIKLYNNNKVDYGNSDFLYNKLININKEVLMFISSLKESGKLSYYIGKRTITKYTKLYGSIVSDKIFYLSLRNIEWTSRLFNNRKKLILNPVKYKKRKFLKI